MIDATILAVAAVTGATAVAVFTIHLFATVHGTRLARRILVSTGVHRNPAQRNVSNVLSMLPVNDVMAACLEDRTDGAVNIVWPLSPNQVLLEVTDSSWSLRMTGASDIATLGGKLTDPRKVAKATRKAVSRARKGAL